MNLQVLLSHLLILGIFWPISLSGQESRPRDTIIEIPIKLNNGDTLTVEEGRLFVPEKRSNLQSKLIPLSFIRLRSRTDNPGNPIVYLAGGPGGAGTQSLVGRRFKMFDDLRDIADVIVLDQRGTGLSNTIPECVSSVKIPEKEALSEESYTTLQKQALEECVSFWENEGVDILGYTTLESAKDIIAIKEFLNVEKLNLLGISYGTHLALATAKYFPESIEKMVLASPEGLDQTAKLPSRHNAYLMRLQNAINKAGYSSKYRGWDDITTLMTSVKEKVEQNHIEITVPEGRNNPEFIRTLGAFELQLITGYMMNDPSNALSILEGYSNALDGDFKWFRRWFDWTYDGEFIAMEGMSTAMNLASGISEERLETLNDEATKAFVGRALNFPMPQLRHAIEGLDLGDDFRSSFTSDHEVLLLSGTLDGRTFPEGHNEIAKNFTGSSVLTVKNGGHNIFLSDKRIIPMIYEFFDGNHFQDQEITVSFPTLEE